MRPTIRLGPTNRGIYALPTMALIRSSCVRRHKRIASWSQEWSAVAFTIYFRDLGTPVELSNDMLEGKPRRAGDTTMRFLIEHHGGRRRFLRHRQGLGATLITMPISV